MKRPQFVVEQSFLGDLDAGEVITVQWYVNSDAGQPVSGVRYCMFLTKHIAVFYDDDLYVMEEIKDFSDGSEADFRGKIKSVTDSIVSVIPSENSPVSQFYPTENRVCTVTNVYRGGIQEGDVIRITFFQDQDIQAGEEVLVLLPDCSESAPVYTLAARNSVFSWKEAERIPALRKLLHDGF